MSTEQIREQITALVHSLAPSEAAFGDLMSGILGDVARARDERMPLFPVVHHGPASALQLLRVLRRNPPKVLFLELCEDMQGSLPSLVGARFPVALQAFAGVSDTFPADWLPLSVVAPISPFSAELQAIAWAASNPDCTLVLVDRAVDHVFQWSGSRPEVPEETEDLDDEEEDSGHLHGGAVGVELGGTEPTLQLFVERLIANARCRNYQEWWTLYVEQVVAGCDLQTYREVLFLVGSLIRRLGRKEDDLVNDRRRESYMWSRIKSFVEELEVAPEDCLYVCGAAHTASDVPEWGIDNPLRSEPPPRTGTPWMYGVIPSSYTAIEHQFSMPAGTLAQSSSRWERELARQGLVPFEIPGAKPGKKPKKAPAPPAPAEAGDTSGFLLSPPPPTPVDEEELLRWSVEIVARARKAGYLASTADAIAIWHTSRLLAGIRNRTHPTPGDFTDAAITCLEKDRVPKRRNVMRLCEVLLGGDKLGHVAEDSTPPLTRDVYARLAPLGVNLHAKNIQRALLDLRSKPELLPCSDLLWKLHALVGPPTIRPIMGEKVLGRTPIQESWDLDLGKYQGQLIQLGYQGLTVETVLEKRYRKAAFGDEATTVDALAAAHDALLYLGSLRLVAELGERATRLLVTETGGNNAEKVFEHVRILVHHFRSQPDGVPQWLRQVVSTGYAHYASLLPTAFADGGTSPGELAAMLAFVFTLEGLALAEGCSRSQLLIAIKQAGPVTTAPEKLGLLWTAEWLLGIRTLDELRGFFDALFENPLMVPALPGYVSGFLLALSFTPLVAGLAVEVMSKAFGRLPESVLVRWLPALLTTLRSHAGTVLPTLILEAAAIFPKRVADIDRFVPPWEGTAPAPRSAVVVERGPEATLLRAWPATLEAWATALGEPLVWAEAGAASDSATSDRAAGAAPTDDPAHRLLAAHGATLAAWSSGT